MSISTAFSSMINLVNTSFLALSHLLIKILATSMTTPRKENIWHLGVSEKVPWMILSLPKDIKKLE